MRLADAGFEPRRRETVGLPREADGSHALAVVDGVGLARAADAVRVPVPLRGGEARAVDCTRRCGQGVAARRMYAPPGRTASSFCAIGTDAVGDRFS